MAQQWICVELRTQQFWLADLCTFTQWRCSHGMEMFFQVTRWIFITPSKFHRFLEWIWMSLKHVHSHWLVRKGSETCIIAHIVWMFCGCSGGAPVPLGRRSGRLWWGRRQVERWAAAAGGGGEEDPEQVVLLRRTVCNPSITHCSTTVSNLAHHVVSTLNCAWHTETTVAIIHLYPHNLISH